MRFSSNKDSVFCRTQRSGFTLIELLVVISIIGVLSTIAMTSLNVARAKARDARRLSDMEQIRIALEMYKSDHGYYPNENSTATTGDGGWEMSYEDGGDFIDALKDEGYFPNGVPVDPVNNSSKCYYYYRYTGISSNCNLWGNGEYYVLAVRDMETSGRPHPSSPGWSCPDRDTWVTSYDWVTGEFTGW